MNYAKIIPRDTGDSAMQNFPAPYQATEQDNNPNAVASSMIYLQPTTSELEVTTFGGQGCMIRWIPATETASVAPYGSVIASGVGANYDHYCPPGWVRQFVIPKETGGSPTGQIGSVNGLFQRVAIINAGVVASSVITSQF